ncbi:MAG TPA: DMT family transporter [Acetobacteraceae bacterium]|nr:DMT family transporter [Acetobacteraceae bacterium]
MQASSSVRGRGGAAGILLALFAYALFSVHDATIKWLVAELPVSEVLFFRSAAITIVCLAIGRRRLLERALTTRMKAPLVLRSLMVLTAFFLYFTAARSLPLAELLSLYFAAPLIVTILAVPMLGERVSPGHWLAVLVGFIGVMVVTDPFGLHVSLPALLVLIAASLWAYGVILMRQVARHESSLVQIFYVSVIFTLVTGVLSVPSWRAPSGWELALLLGVSVFGGLAQFSLFESARRAGAAVLATVEYSSLLWAFILGYAIWGDIPPLSTFGGAGLILLAGLLLVATERFARVSQSPR